MPPTSHPSCPATNDSTPLETVFDNIFALVAYLDRDFNFVRVNRAYAEAGGRAPEYFVGKNHFELYPDEENEAIFRQVVESREPYVAYGKAFEYPDQPERGTTYWDWTLQPLCDGQGKVGGLLLTLIEVTERVLSEQARAQADAKFRALFDSAGDGIIIHDLDGRILNANSTACEHLGYRHDELLQLRVHDLNAPEYCEQFAPKTEALLRDGYTVVETEHLHKNGHHLPVEVNARLIEYEGQPAVLAVVRDMAWRREAEAQLRLSKKNIKALLDANTESAILIEPDGEIVAINETAAARFGHSVRQMQGENIYSFMNPELAASRRQRIEQSFASGQPQSFEDRRGQRRFRTSLQPVLDDQGQAIRLAIYATDITETSRAREIEQMLRVIDHSILQGCSIEQMFAYTCNALLEIFELRIAWVGRKEADGSIAAVYSTDTHTDYSKVLSSLGVRWDNGGTALCPTGSAIHDARVQFIRTAEQRGQAWARTAESFGLESIFSFPLFREGEVYGALTLMSDRADIFDDEATCQRLIDVANHLQVAVDTAFTHEQLRILGTALAAAGNGILITGLDGTIEWTNDAFSRQSGYSREEAIGSTPSLLKSGRQDSDYYRKLWAHILDGRSWTDETVERRKDGSLYTVRQTITPVRNEQGKITHFVTIHDDITSLKESQERIRQLAHFDTLTGLPNRALFFDRLELAIALARREQRPFSLLFLDLDRFKPINDTLGHAAGDELLRQVAQRLRGTLREVDTVARLAGDEFTVILNNVSAKSKLEFVVAKIRKALGHAYSIEGEECFCAASIGIARYPEDGQSADDLLRAADAAMYTAKKAGRNAYAFADAVMASAAPSAGE